MIMHKTGAHWESGALPGPDLLARVRQLIGELSAAGALGGAEGLRPSSEGARLRSIAGERTIVAGPFDPGNELPAGFTIIRAASLEEAVEWATRQAAILGDVEIDIRPVTEPWDIGLEPRPANATSRRYMLLRKATAATEAGVTVAPAARSRLSQLIEQATRDGVHLGTETMRSSRKGRRYTNTSTSGISYFDGPFAETKELIGGYVIVSVDSLEAAGQLAARYIDAVEAAEVDVRELE